MNSQYISAYATLEREHWWFLVRKKIILQFLHKYCSAGSLKVLNIGAAGGSSSQWLSVFGKVDSVENEPAFLQHLKALQINVVNASVTALPFADESFNLVCAFDVLEHVHEDQQSFAEIARVCKPGGVICITVPASPALWSNHDVVNGHVRRYTKQKFLALGKRSESIQIKKFSFFNTLLFFPIAIARKFQKSKMAKSDFERFQTSQSSNKLLRKIFSWELPLLRFLSLPFGVSMIGIWKKQG